MTANDVGDADAGANGLLNFPVLSSAVVNSTAQTTVAGSFDGLAAVNTYRIEFFASTSGRCVRATVKAQRYLGYVDVVTDGAGHATFNVALAATVAAGESVSATATDLTANETSELSAGISATNSAPVLDASGSPTLATINEDAAAPVGAVGTLVSSLVDFASPAGEVDNVTDADTIALLGIAITGADTSNGAWWISTDNGTSWSALGAVSDASARLLAADGSTRIAFQPNADYNGTQSAAITFRAWDGTSGNNGGNADTTVNGGITAFSTATDTASLTVTAVNDAPVLTASGLTVSEGQTVTLSGANIGISDVDSASFTYSVSGLSGGIFQLSGAPGVPITSFTSAQLTGGLVQFVDDGNEVAPSFSLTASDGSASSSTVAASITYTPVNDAPVLANTPLTLDRRRRRRRAGRRGGFADRRLHRRHHRSRHRRGARHRDHGDRRDQRHLVLQHQRRRELEPRGRGEQHVGAAPGRRRQHAPVLHAGRQLQRQQQRRADAARLGPHRRRSRHPGRRQQQRWHDGILQRH